MSSWLPYSSATYSSCLPQLDTSLYPKEHTCFAYDQESDAHETVSEVLENVSSASPKPLKDTIVRLVTTMGAALGYIDDEMDEDGDDDDDDGMSLGTDGAGDTYQAPQMAEQTLALKKDFLEVVAADWRPGLIRFGSNEFGKSFDLLEMLLHLIIS